MKERKIACLLNGLIKTLVVAGVMTAHVSFAVPTWTASTLPYDGKISGAAGDTIGWGYSIANLDPDLWLVLTSASADPFANGTPFAVFDLPILAPSTTRSVAFDGVNGLYGLTWDTAAPTGFVNAGDFLLSAQWYDLDPLAGGSLVGAATDTRLAYSATVTEAPPVVVPEPSTLILTATALMLATVLFWRKRKG